LETKFSNRTVPPMVPGYGMLIDHTPLCEAFQRSGNWTGVTNSPTFHSFLINLADIREWRPCSRSKYESCKTQDAAVTLRERSIASLRARSSV
jgi:hypothetical protein